MTKDTSESWLAQGMQDSQKQHLVWDFSSAWLALAFVIYGGVAVAFLTINVPPFQVPDELVHFERAAQIADGVLIGGPVSVRGADGLIHQTSGGLVDPAIQMAEAPFSPLEGHGNIRVSRTDWAPAIRWSSARVAAGFPNTGMYPPFFYVPSALAILAGRSTNLSVVQTLTLSRIFTAVTAVAIGGVAVAMAGAAAPWIFTILTLPMSLFLFASASQDALLVSCSGLAGALTVRALHSSKARKGALLAAIAILLTAVAMARPPYASLALVPLVIPGVRLRWRLFAAFAIAVCAVAWAVTGVAQVAYLHYALSSSADPSAQVTRLVHDPALAIHVALTTLIHYSAAYRNEFIGVLGFLDTPLSRAYYRTATFMLAIAAAATILSMDADRLSPVSILAIAGGVVVSICGLFAIQYIVWTTPGASTVEGVEGRYFLVLALVSAPLLSAVGGKKLGRLREPLLLLVAAFPMISLAVLMRAIVLRYYLG